MSWVVPQLDGAHARAARRSTSTSTSAPAPICCCACGRWRSTARSPRRAFTDPKLDAIRLHREDYVFVGAKALLAGARSRATEHAASHTLLDAIAGPAALPLLARRAGRRRSAALRAIVRLGSIEAIRARVAEGAGVAVLPAYLVARDLAARRLVRDPAEPSCRSTTTSGWSSAPTIRAAASTSCSPRACSARPSGEPTFQITERDPESRFSPRRHGDTEVFVFLRASVPPW